MQKLLSRQITAWVAMATIVFVMLVSTLYISEHINHECSGSECQICYVIEQCSNNLKSFGTVLIAVFVSLFLNVSIHKATKNIINDFSNDSLISQKVRMNN